MSAADEAPGMNLHTWLRWRSMIPNVHIMVEQNGFRIKFMRLDVNKEPILFCLNVWLSNWLMSRMFAFLFCLLHSSVLTRESVAQLQRVDSCGLRCQRGKCQLEFYGALWWYAGAKLRHRFKNNRQGIKNGTLRMQSHIRILICSCIQKNTRVLTI